MNSSTNEFNELSRTLEAYKIIAKDNEKILLRLWGTELQLIHLDSLSAIFSILTNQHKDNVHLESATLALVDVDFSYRQAINNEGFSEDQFPNVIFLNDEKRLRDLLPSNLVPRLGKYNNKTNGFLFPKRGRNPASIALMPLIRHHKLIGTLNLLSHDQSRFIEGNATDFMSHFATVAAICLENAILYAKTQNQTVTDALTGLHNRRFFDEAIIRFLTISESNHSPLSCLFLDIDYFKKINDTYGHAVGDQVLSEFSKLIEQNIPNQCVPARYGGEEFVILLPNTDSDNAGIVAESIRNAVSNHIIKIENNNISITVSIGVNTFSPQQNSSNIEEIAKNLINGTDEAVYKAKENGRNRVVIYSKCD